MKTIWFKNVDADLSTNLDRLSICMWRRSTTENIPREPLKNPIYDQREEYLKIMLLRLKKMRDKISMTVKVRTKTITWKERRKIWWSQRRYINVAVEETTHVLLLWICTSKRITTGWFRKGLSEGQGAWKMRMTARKWTSRKRNIKLFRKPLDFAKIVEQKDWKTHISNAYHVKTTPLAKIASGRQITWTTKVIDGSWYQKTNDWWYLSL